MPLDPTYLNSALNYSSMNAERTSNDKVLARQDVDRGKELQRKEKLTREDLMELLYLCISTESKLVNYTEWTRYVILKYFVWIREFIKVAEGHYDYEIYLHKQEKLYRRTKGKRGFKLEKRTKAILEQNDRLIQNTAKFLIDVYLNIARTSLSVNATGFLEMLKHKFELIGTQTNLDTTAVKSGGLLTKLGLGKDKEAK